MDILDGRKIAFRRGVRFPRFGSWRSRRRRFIFAAPPEAFLEALLPNSFTSSRNALSASGLICSIGTVGFFDSSKACSIASLMSFSISESESMGGGATPSIRSSGFASGLDGGLTASGCRRASYLHGGRSRPLRHSISGSNCRAPQA